MTDLSETQRIGIGQFADVFQMQDASRVCKLLRSAGSSRWREWAERVHQQELGAYDVAASHPALMDHTARCFGAAVVSRVTSATGEDISDRYLLSTGIVLERLSGDEAKAAGLDPTSYPHVYVLLNAFDEVGVEAGDASVFGYEAPHTTKFVDITTRYGARIVAEVI